ncbi:hypothetical protein BZA77DRAFT_49805 [Pyronema omphalodes]|nr:hypothetical protein BZA77DRAFT_49805 [Pyronema omphalodes]
MYSATLPMLPSFSDPLFQMPPFHLQAHIATWYRYLYKTRKQITYLIDPIKILQSILGWLPIIDHNYGILKFLHILHNIVSISRFPFLPPILCSSDNYLLTLFHPISYPYPTHILPISYPYPTHILPISYPYPTHILPISYPYPTHILPISYPYPTHILPIS